MKLVPSPRTSQGVYRERQTCEQYNVTRTSERESREGCREQGTGEQAPLQITTGLDPEVRVIKRHSRWRGRQWKRQRLRISEPNPELTSRGVPSMAGLRHN